MHKAQQKLRIKKKIKINSLEAAICNVALFKCMKDKDFKDTIFISYCQQGVILQATSELQWKKAHDHIEGFLHNKKIQLLTDGYDKDVYENLINKGLKQITRRIRQKQEECPYINIIHYQKLRKSCEYMDKQKYVDPLKDWERKNKKNPNFAFLIVQPKIRYEEVKKSLLQFLTNQPVPFCHVILDPLYFMYLMFHSPIKQKLKVNFHRRQIQIYIQKDQEGQIIKATNFTNLDLQQYGYSIIKEQSTITKAGVGLESITSKQLSAEIKNAKLYCKDNPTQLIQEAFTGLAQQFGENFLFVPYKQEQEDKYKGLIEKYTNTKFSKEDFDNKIENHKICQFQQIEFIDEIKVGMNFKAWRVCINNCPFMIHEYSASDIEMDTFMIYLDQLQLYYCTFMIRYYGIAVKCSRPGIYNPQQKQIYYLIFDYHRNSLAVMQESETILDSMQVGSIILHIFYLLNFLHSHEQPRCFGPITLNSIYWPMAAVLPYFGQNTDDDTTHSIENDVKQLGLLMQELIGETEDEELFSFIQQMTHQNKYQRPSVKKCIAHLQDFLCL